MKRCCVIDQIMPILTNWEEGLLDFDCSKGGLINKSVNAEAEGED